MSEWRRGPLRTSCKRYSVNPHHQLKNLCALCRLEISTTNQSPLVLCRNRDTIAISSQICVFVCINPFHRIDLATCFGELTRSFIRQNDSYNELHPLVPFGAPRLSEGSLHIGRAGWKVKISFTVLLLQHFLLVAFAHTTHPHLKESVPLVFAMSLLEQM